MAFSKLTLIMMRKHAGSSVCRCSSRTDNASHSNLAVVPVPADGRMSSPRWSEPTCAVPGSALFQALWDSADVSNSGDRMADPGCGGPISPCPRAAPRRSCSPSPTALGLWLGPRSAAAGPPAPPPDEHTKHHFFFFSGFLDSAFLYLANAGSSQE